MRNDSGQLAIAISALMLVNPANEKSLTARDISVMEVAECSVTCACSAVRSDQPSSAVAD
jgi:hypothetical protein